MRYRTIKTTLSARNGRRALLTGVYILVQKMLHLLEQLHAVLLQHEIMSAFADLHMALVRRMGQLGEVGVVLKLPNLAAYRALGHGQFSGGAREAQVARGSVEELQCGQRRQQPSPARGDSSAPGTLGMSHDAATENAVLAERVL